MKRSLLTPRRLLALVVALLLISSMLSAPVADRVTRGPRSLVSAALNPVTGVLRALGRSIRGSEQPDTPWPGATDVELELELGRALRIIRQLEGELRRAQDQVAQLSQIRDQFGLQGVRLIDARVTAYNGSTIDPVITIDKGSSKGLRKGSVVASGFNLVGEVVRVGPVSADVKLITAANTNIIARLVTPIADVQPRILEAMLHRAKDGQYFVTEPGVDSPVQVGDLAHLSSERWPPEAQGFVVGKVTVVDKDASNPFLAKRVIVEPMLPLAALRRVTVLVPAN